MRLTPADVHNVAFKKPSIGKRGYDEDEVDAFLDLVEAELSRLIEENNELTQRLSAAQAGGFAGGAPVEQAPQYQPEAVQQYIEQAPVETQHDHEAVEAQAAPVSVEKPVEVAPPVVATPEPVAAVAAEAGPAAHHVQAAKLLGLAQETAERLTGDAAAEAEATRAAAKAESEKLVGDAQTEANRLVFEAQNKSDTMVNEATANAEALERDSRIRADAMDREAQGKYSQVMGQLTEQRTTLEKKIDDLRVYEREYRSRLKSWITEQLSQLDESGAPANENSEQHA
ncbi:DivIVA domain-containing protein [Nakamurella sp. UYEF19]|uniref:DivIVA-like cell division protein Wag31 n=1 Tax=Nakamurella sp. UYEF19 TaxID=1756392 RepID=UPI00339A8F48